MRPVRVLLGVGGLVAVGYGICGLVAAPAGPRPLAYLLFSAVLLLSHDLALMPVTLAVGALVARFAPPAARGALRAGLVVSAAVGLVALPFVLHRGYSPANPSALPLNYAHGLLVVLAAVWLGVVAGSVARYLRRRDR